ncbi:hypothetical protein ACLOJK_009325 [Asimina triloba]
MEKFNSRKQHDGSSNTPATSTSRSAFVVFRNDSIKSEIFCVTTVSSNENIEYLDATPKEQEIAECHALQSVCEVLHEEDEEEQEQEQENGSPIDDWRKRIVLHSQQPSEVNETKLAGSSGIQNLFQGTLIFGDLRVSIMSSHVSNKNQHADFQNQHADSSLEMLIQVQTPTPVSSKNQHADFQGILKLLEQIASLVEAVGRWELLLQFFCVREMRR